MPQRDEVKKYVIERLHQRSPQSRKMQLGDDTSLLETGILDSFALLDLVSEVEQKFGIQVDVGNYEFEQFSTLGGFCDAISESG